MANTAQLVRQRVQDFPQPIDDTYYGDGTANRYKFAYTNFVSASAFVAPGATAWSATGATFNVSGYVDFANAISANTAFRIVGVQSVWSDEMIGEYITAGGGVLGAALQCAYDLLYDNVKRSRWMAANGAQYDNMQAGAYVKDIISAIKAEMFEEATQYGAMTSWAENQGEW
jgi:hypothetical protein